VRILIVDDHAAVRKGLTSILGSRGDIEICGEAANGQDAVVSARELNPDLIIMDINMPVLGGFGALKEIRAFLPCIPILFFSVHDSKQMIHEAQIAGVQGLVAKDQAGEDVLNAVDALWRGETFFPA
jgi:two-component system NarL family response regulator